MEHHRPKLQNEGMEGHKKVCLPQKQVLTRNTHIQLQSEKYMLHG